jgi:hypothetical protein
MSTGAILGCSFAISNDVVFLAPTFVAIIDKHLLVRVDASQKRIESICNWRRCESRSASDQLMTG